MSTSKVIAVFVLVLAVAMAADGNKKTNSSSVHHVGSLVAKARLSSVNGTAVNATMKNMTEINNSTTEKTMTRRSLGIDKSDGTRWQFIFKNRFLFCWACRLISFVSHSQLTSVWWRIPTAIWDFVSQVLLDPILSALRRLLSIFGLYTEQIMPLPLVVPSPSPLNFVSQFMPQFTTPIRPVGVWFIFLIKIIVHVIFIQCNLLYYKKPYSQMWM